MLHAAFEQHLGESVDRRHEHPPGLIEAVQTMQLVELVRGKRLFAPVLLSVMTGLRRGEVVALRWRDVDIAGKMMSIVQAAEQTKAGVRY